MDQRDTIERLPSAREDAERADSAPSTPQTRAPSYRLAFQDSEFLLRDELRPVRLQLELLKPELELQAQGIAETIVVFGSARIQEAHTAQARADAAEQRAALDRCEGPATREARIARRLAELSRYYDEARAFAALVAGHDDGAGRPKFTVVTGGGPGIMEAANRGAAEVGAATIGHNIVLPHEQAPNPWVSPELCFRFHYFALRKMHLLTRARALVVFPGGFGTLDELFETLCLIQTGKARPMPVLLFGEAYWRRLVSFDAMVENGVIDDHDLDLFQYVETAVEAWAAIASHYGLTIDTAQGARQ